MHFGNYYTSNSVVSRVLVQTLKCLIKGTYIFLPHLFVSLGKSRPVFLFWRGITSWPNGRKLGVSAARFPTRFPHAIQPLNMRYTISFGR